MGVGREESVRGAWREVDVDELERGWRAENRKVRSERKYVLVACDKCGWFWKGAGAMKKQRKTCR